jgi:hypothetical protein
MNTPKSFKPYHGCFDRFQGCLDISANFNPGEIFIDNRSAVDMGATFKDTQRTLHMMRRYHYVREGVENNQHALI